MVLEVALTACSSQHFELPAIPTQGLDPAVAHLIEKAMADVRAAPRDGGAWGRLGSVLMHYEFVPQTQSAFDTAERLDPQNPRWPYLHAVLLMTHDPGAVEAKLQRAVVLAPEQPDMPRLRLAQWLSERGQVTEAESQFHILLRRSPQHPLAQLGLARLRQEQGRWMESTQALASCLTDPHTTKSAHTLWATAHRALGDTASADAAAQHSATLPTDRPWPDPFWDEATTYRVGLKARLQHATTLMDQGQAPEALVVLQDTTRDYLDDDESWYLLGWAHNQRSSPVEAERSLREHLRRSPQSPKGHAQLAVALLRQQRYADAIPVLEAALRLKSTWRELHYNLGYACAQLGRGDEAIRHLRNALKHDPNHVPTYTSLAELLSRRGRRDEARQLLQEALLVSPGDPRVLTLRDRVQ